MTRPQVVVIGGGFGGLYATRRLARGPVDVTVLDTTGVHTFQPLLYQCATGMLSEGQLTAPLRSLFRRHRNVRTLLARAVDLAIEDQTVTALRPDGTPVHVPYDHLIVAIGVQQTYFGHDDFAPHAPGMKTIEDALTIRRRVLDAFEMAESLPTADARRPWMTFALVGAGPTGVELAGQLRELAAHTLTQQFRSLDPAQARVLLYDGSDAPLASFGPALSRRATRTLEHLGVELHLQTKVTTVDAHGFEITDRNGATSRIQARTVLWTAGVAAPPFAHALAQATGAQQDHSGRLQVQPDLTLPGHPEIHVRRRPRHPRRPARGRRSRHGRRLARRRTSTTRRRRRTCPGTVSVPGPRQRRLHQPRPRHRLRRPTTPVRPTRMASLGPNPHHLPHRLPQPRRRHPHLDDQPRHRQTPRDGHPHPRPRHRTDPLHTPRRPRTCRARADGPAGR